MGHRGYNYLNNFSFSNLMTSQKQIWNAIAPEWFEFKKNPGRGVEDFLKSKKGKILDLGSGAGRHLLKTKGKLYLVDFSEEMIKLAKKKAKQKKISAEFAVADLTKLSFEDNFFDYSISISAFHCLKPKDHKKAIKELYRVMKPKSKSLIGVWNFNSKRFNQKKGKEKLVGWQDKGKRYYYLFEEKEIHNLFKKIGFKILSTHNSEMMINFVVTK